VHRHGRWTVETIQATANVGAALLFVLGCLGFYAERLHTGATTAFLAGSLLFLVSALGAVVGQRNGLRAVDEHGSPNPSPTTEGASSS
jgi:drug/metabolite transporter (DMT)-like permease